MSTEMKMYEIKVWLGDWTFNHDTSTAVKKLETVQCLIKSVTLSSLLGATEPKFIQILVGDGEQRYIRTENIIDITRIFQEVSHVRNSK